MRGLSPQRPPGVHCEIMLVSMRQTHESNLFSIIIIIIFFFLLIIFFFFFSFAFRVAFRVAHPGFKCICIVIVVINKLL